MLISTMTVLAIRCPSCGRLEFRGLSLFDLSGNSTWQVECSCGTSLISASKKGKNFMLQYNCLMCDSFHNSTFYRWELWSKNVLTLTCSETDLEIGFIGPREKVQRAVQHHERSLAEMAENLGFNDFFEAPDVMYQLLALIYELSENGNVTCGCGNKDIEVEIFPGHLQLHCDVCGAEKTLPAISMTDLEQAKLLQTICLPGHLADRGLPNPKQPWRRRKKSPV